MDWPVTDWTTVPGRHFGQETSLFIAAGHQNFTSTGPQKPTFPLALSPMTALTTPYVVPAAAASRKILFLFDRVTGWSQNVRSGRQS